MNRIADQIREMAPSAKEPLFRRLLVEDSLAYLREKRGIIGFEVDVNVAQSLSGFALIAIQKHTLYAYCSDLHEKPKLILFPPLDKLFDGAFELLDLQVTKRVYTDATFMGRSVEQGTLRALVRSLTPPVKDVDISTSVQDAMIRQMKEPAPVPVIEREEVPVRATEVPRPVLPVEEPITELPEEPPYDGFEENEYDAYDGFDTYETGGYDAYDDDTDASNEEAVPVEEVPEEPEPPKEDPRTIQLKAQTFGNLSEVSEFCATTLQVPRPVAVNVVNKALQSKVSPEFRITLAIKLFAKLFDEKKL